VYLKDLKPNTYCKYHPLQTNTAGSQKYGKFDSKFLCQNIITGDIISTGCTRPVWHMVRVERLRGWGVRWAEHVAHVEEIINENGSVKTCIEITS
jgi:hypothetical protein